MALAACAGAERGPSPIGGAWSAGMLVGAQVGTSGLVWSQIPVLALVSHRWRGPPRRRHARGVK